MAGPDPVVMSAIQSGIDRANAHAVSNAARSKRALPRARPSMPRKSPEPMGLENMGKSYFSAFSCSSTEVAATQSVKVMTSKPCSIA